MLVVVCLSLASPGRAQDLSQHRSLTGPARQATLQELKGLYKPIVDEVWKVLVENVDPEDAKKLQDVQSDYTSADTILGFSSRLDDSGMITISVGGLRSQVMLIDAAGLVNSGIVSPEWYGQYILYLRRQHLRRQWTMSPYEAAGVSSAVLPESFFANVAHLHTEAFLFALAHEAAHIVHADSMERKADESLPTYRSRIRQQEMRADRYALDLFRKLNGTPGAFMITLGAALLVYEPRMEKEEENPHPPDRARLIAIVRQILQDNSKGLWAGSKEEKAEAARNMEKTLHLLENDRLYQDMLEERDDYMNRSRFELIKNLNQ